MSYSGQAPRVRLCSTFPLPGVGEEPAAESQAESARSVLTGPLRREPSAHRPFPDRSMGSGWESFQASKRLSNFYQRRTLSASQIGRLRLPDRSAWLYLENCLE